MRVFFKKIRIIKKHISFTYTYFILINFSHIMDFMKFPSILIGEKYFSHLHIS